MKSTTFKTEINAPAERVWEILWGQETYPKWTSAFSPGSRVETDWREGSRVLFLDVNGDGMIAEVAKRRDNEFMSFKHLGELKDGKEDLESDRVKKWAGATENYTLTESGQGTELKVEMEIDEEYDDFFEKTWPRALEHVKMLSEETNPMGSEFIE